MKIILSLILSLLVSYSCMAEEYPQEFINTCKVIEIVYGEFMSEHCNGFQDRSYNEINIQDSFYTWETVFFCQLGKYKVADLIKRFNHDMEYKISWEYKDGFLSSAYVMNNGFILFGVCDEVNSYTSKVVIKYLHNR